MSSYTRVFGGQTVDPADLSYQAYTLTASITLVWPFQATQDSNVAAAKIDVNPTLASLTVTMPDATVVSVGQDILANNTGANTFTLLDNTGGTIIAIPPGQQYYCYLIDNSTTQGSWRVVLFGSSTSPLAASALAGYGLAASAAQLMQNLAALVLNADYTFTASDRASVARNNAGAVTWSFNASSTLTNGWFVYVINGGSGVITLDPNGAETIDGSATKIINPGESCIVFCDGSNLWTVGYGRAISSTVTGTSVNIAGSGDTALDATQVAAQVQNFTGALTGNATVTYGTSPGYWFVYNNTSGAFSTTFRTTALDPGVSVAQGSFSILRSDGATMSVAFTATSGTVTNVSTTADLTGGPITTTGTLGLSNTGVTPGTYGDASHTVSAQVDGKGRLVSMAQNLISILISQVQSFTSAAFRAQVSDPTGNGSVVFNNGPTMVSADMGSASFAVTQSASDNSTKLATTAYVDAAITAVINSMFTTGDILHTYNTMVQRPGWVYATGSIGSASSGATTRANADTSNLFTFLWNNYSNTQCPVSGGRGASAAVDFAANKTLTMLDLRGVVLAAAEDMGGTNRGNLGGNPSTGGFSGTASIGTSAGEKGHVQIANEVAAHTHPTVGDSGIHAGSTGGPVSGVTSSGNNVATSGNNTTTGQALNVTQPTSTVNILIKL